MHWGIFLLLNLLGGFLALQAMPLIHIYDQPLLAYALLLLAAAIMTVATVAVLRPLYFPAYSRFGRGAQRLILAGATLTAFALTIGIAHVIVDTGLACDCLTRMPLMDALYADTNHVVLLLLVLSLIYTVSIWTLTEFIKNAIRRRDA
jgi:hypothetical protein